MQNGITDPLLSEGRGSSPDNPRDRIGAGAEPPLTGVPPGTVETLIQDHLPSAVDSVAVGLVPGVVGGATGAVQSASPSSSSGSSEPDGEGVEAITSRPLTSKEKITIRIVTSAGVCLTFTWANLDMDLHPALLAFFTGGSDAANAMFQSSAFMNWWAKTESMTKMQKARFTLELMFSLVGTSPLLYVACSGINKRVSNPVAQWVLKALAVPGYAAESIVSVWGTGAMLAEAKRQYYTFGSICVPGYRGKMRQLHFPEVKEDFEAITRRQPRAEMLLEQAQGLYQQGETLRKRAERRLNAAKSLKKSRGDAGEISRLTDEATQLNNQADMKFVEASRLLKDNMPLHPYYQSASTVLSYILGGGTGVAYCVTGVQLISEAMLGALGALPSALVSEETMEQATDVFASGWMQTILWVTNFYPLGLGVSYGIDGARRFLNQALPLLIMGEWRDRFAMLVAMAIAGASTGSSFAMAFILALRPDATAGSKFYNYYGALNAFFTNLAPLTIEDAYLMVDAFMACPDKTQATTRLLLDICCYRGRGARARAGAASATETTSLLGSDHRSPSPGASNTGAVAPSLDAASAGVVPARKRTESFEIEQGPTTAASAEGRARHAEEAPVDSTCSWWRTVFCCSRRRGRSRPTAAEIAGSTADYGSMAPE